MKNYEIELNKQNLDELIYQNLDELMKQTLLNILSAKGIIYTYYKNKKLTEGNYGNSILLEKITFNKIDDDGNLITDKKVLQEELNLDRLCSWICREQKKIIYKK